MWTIQSWYEQARTNAMADPDGYRAKAEHKLGVYSKALPGISREEIGKTLAKSNRERLDAAPSFTKYPELRGMRELIDAQWRGTRDGAGLDEPQAAMLADGLFYFQRVLNSGGQKPKAQCSCVYFPTSDHGPLLANNLDTDMHEPFGTPPWPAASEHLIFGGVSSGVFLDEESPEIFPAPVYTLAARYCRTTGETVDLFTRYNFFWGPCNAIVVDRNHRVAMIEKSVCRIGVRFSPDGFGFITAMTAEDPGMAAYLADRRAASLLDRGLPNPCADTRYWGMQETRRRIMTRLLDEARKNPTVETLRALMQYRGPDGVVCDNGDVPFPGDPPIEHTIRTYIACLAEGRTMWWTRDNERNIPSWQNRRADVKFENVWLWK